MKIIIDGQVMHIIKGKELIQRQQNGTMYQKINMFNGYQSVLLC